MSQLNVVVRKAMKERLDNTLELINLRRQADALETTLKASDEFFSVNDEYQKYLHIVGMPEELLLEALQQFIGDSIKLLEEKGPDIDSAACWPMGPKPEQIGVALNNVVKSMSAFQTEKSEIRNKLRPKMYSTVEHGLEFIQRCLVPHLPINETFVIGYRHAVAEMRAVLAN